MKYLVVLCSGLLFGFGLALSGMMDPRRVQGFLDVTGTWDPTLAFVMGGALLVTVPASRYVLRLPMPLMALKFSIPKRGDIDKNLVLGAVLFGVGWGLAGLCPGPALAGLISLKTESLVFAGSLLVGMIFQRVTLSKAGS